MPPLRILQNMFDITLTMIFSRGVMGGADPPCARGVVGGAAPLDPPGVAGVATFCVRVCADLQRGVVGGGTPLDPRGVAGGREALCLLGKKAFRCS